MPRSVNHVASRAKRKRILKLTRGYFGARKNVWTVAKNTWEKGLTYAYRDRRAKKRNFRSLWIQRINAAARLEGMSYSALMGALSKAGIEINRKVLADLAVKIRQNRYRQTRRNHSDCGALLLFIPSSCHSLSCRLQKDLGASGATDRRRYVSTCRRQCIVGQN